MGMKELPKQYSFACDLCGCEHIGAGDAAFKSVPDGWSTARLHHAHVDIDGYKRAGTEEFLLCPDHAAKLCKFLDSEKQK